jgi:hypothetical protein
MIFFACILVLVFIGMSLATYKLWPERKTPPPPEEPRHYKMTLPDRLKMEYNRER